MKKQYILFVVIACVVIGFILLSDWKEGGGEVIKIGFIGPLTGDVAGVGIPSRAAAEYAVDQVNETNEVNGRKFVLVPEDGQCNAKAAASAAQKLLEVDRVAAILGGLCSSETLAIAPLAEQTQTVLLSYASSDPSITALGDYVFRIYPSDAFQGDYAARYALEHLGTKAAIIYTESSATKSIQGVFSKLFAELGGEIVLNESIQQGTKDVRSSVAKLKSVDADFLYAPTYTGEAVSLLQQLSQSNIQIPVLANDGWEDSVIYQTAGLAAEGARFTAVKVPDAPKKFVEELGSRIGKQDFPTIPALQAYDGIKVFAEVFEKTRGDKVGLKNALAKTAYNGISNPMISFDQNGDLAGVQYVVKIIRNGSAVIVE